MSSRDYKLYDMPTMFGRAVKKVNPKDETKWIRDDDWYQAIRKKYFSLFCFLQDNDLVQRRIVGSPQDVEDVVVRMSDLTEEGRTFVTTGADDRWLRSFDKPGSKKRFDDVSYLEKQLSKLRESP